MYMRLLYKSCRTFSLDHSNLTHAVIQTGPKNFKIKQNPQIEGYLTKNSGTKPNMHTVIMIHEWWGFNKSITQTAEIFSNTNIRVFVPDLYRGEAANSVEEAKHKMDTLDWHKALEELSIIKNSLDKDSISLSIVGFCMGGALTFAALSSIAGWKAGGIFYGIPDLNIFRLDKITANVIAHFGQLDPLVGFSDESSARKLKQDANKFGYPIDVKIYESCNHAFCNQDSKYFKVNARDEAFNLTRQLIDN